MVLEGIWKKAAELVTTEGAIAPAPGHPPEARNVLSRQSGFHTVKPVKGGRFTCDCVRYKSLDICSHSVATAEVNGCLEAVLARFKKQKQPNITKLALADMPKGRGWKGGKAPRKRPGRTQPLTSSINPLG